MAKPKKEKPDELSRLKKTVQELRADRKVLKSSWEAATQRQGELAAERDEVKSSRDALEQNLDEMRRARDTLVQEIERVTEERDNAQRELRVAQASLEEKKDDVRQLAAKLDEQRLDNESSSSQRKELSAALDARQRELTNLGVEKAAAEAEAQRKGEMLGETLSRVEQLQLNVSVFTNALDARQREVADLTIEKAAVEGRLAGATEVLELETAEAKRLSARCQILELLTKQALDGSRLACRLFAEGRKQEAVAILNVLFASLQSTGQYLETPAPQPETAEGSPATPPGQQPS